MARTSKYAKTLEAPSSAVKRWKAGLYLRLSKEDGDKSESDSIANQRLLGEDFLIENPDIDVMDIYSDDGFTGANFNRPDFQRLIEDIRLGELNCVIVKDLSRFGRNYIEAGQYLEIFFPVMEIRFISILDCIDSFLNPDSMNNISVSFKNVMNEEYCRQTSINVKSTLRLKRENGEHVGSFALYGYAKAPENKNALIIDEEAAVTVRLIFNLFSEGKAISRIRIILNELGIPNPTTYKRLKGMRYKSPNCKHDGLWSIATVRLILTNRMYVGDMVQGRREKISHKIGKIRAIKEENWAVKEDTHAPIIDKTTFFNVQGMMKRDTRISQTNKELSLFAGFLKCADCGRALVRKAYNKSVLHRFARSSSQPLQASCSSPRNKKRRKEYVYYICNTYASLKKSACTRHSIRSDILEKVVFAVIVKQIDMAVGMIDLIEQINKAPIKTAATASMQSALRAKEKEKAKIENILLGLYPDWKNDLIGKEQYVALKAKYEAELERMNGILSGLKKTCDREKEGIDGTNDFLQNFIQFENIEKLSRRVLIGLVDCITIREGGGVEINFKFQDAHQRAAEYIATNGGLPTGAAA
ncbi:recombinase [Clostridia bacterium]|nr:recombinase [Clostridia bacterium]